MAKSSHGYIVCSMNEGTSQNRPKSKGQNADYKDKVWFTMI